MKRFPGLRLTDEASCCAPDPLIRARGLTLRYGAVPAFEGVSLDVNAGCVTALVGPSGCGKTSFLNCINRMTDLLPGAATEGQLEFAGQDILDPGLNVIGLRRRVGMVFQQPNPFPLSVRRNLDLPLREHGIRNRAERALAVESALTDVGLWDEVKDRLDGPAMALSGGQQQRLCIARALVLSPEVLLMDEPCSALDPLSGERVEKLIDRLRGRMTILIVTHNLAQARRLADWAALFWKEGGSGRLVEYGAVEQIFEAPRDELTAAYVRGRAG
ncbi:MAG: phosphate ABC transporter ATP-binding protein [Myxococcota bacterium]